jgi:hypothetical protein
MQELLEKGDVHGEYLSRSEPIMALALAAVNARWTPSEFETAMERSPAYAKLRDRRDAERELERCWKKAKYRVRLSPPIIARNDDLRELHEVRLLVGRTTWPGRAGATDKKVLEAHLQIAERARSIQYSASLRQIADLAGVTARTVWSSQGRLQERHCLQLQKRGLGDLGSEWKLTPSNVSHLSTLLTSWGCEDSVEAEDTSLGQDVWRWGGLGAAARDVFNLLPIEGSISVTTLAQRRGTGESAVYKQLRKLKEHELAVHVGHGQWRRGQVDRAKLDDVAVRLGILGAGKRQRWLHEDERDRYRHRQQWGTLRLQPADAHPPPRGQAATPKPKAEYIRRNLRSAPIAQAARARPVRRGEGEKPRQGQP